MGNHGGVNLTVLCPYQALQEQLTSVVQEIGHLIDPIATAARGEAAQLGHKVMYLEAILLSVHMREVEGEVCIGLCYYAPNPGARYCAWVSLGLNDGKQYSTPSSIFSKNDHFRICLPLTLRRKLRVSFLIGVRLFRKGVIYSHLLLLTIAEISQRVKLTFLR